MTTPDHSIDVSKSPLGTTESASDELDPTTSAEKPDSPHPTLQDDPTKYPHGIKLATILASIFAVVFIVALDRTIIGTAVPKITDEFHSIEDIGWYASAFMLPACSFMLVFGKLYQLYRVKTVYLICVVIFEIGSVICGAAPSSATLIGGRAVAGLGSAGLFSGTIMIIVHTIPLAKRPMYQGGFGAMFGLASVAGPLLGGAFTDKVSWRWCFYINLPVGCVVIVALFFLLHIDDRRPPSITALTLCQKIQRLDPIGTIIFLGGTISLLLALQWGGTEYPWSSTRVVVCLVLASILLLAFIGIQLWRKENATVPPRIISQRSVACAIYFSFFLGASMMVAIYYLPLWFQTIQSTSATTSGLRTLALILPLVLATLIGAQLTLRTGYYVPQMLLCSALVSAGAGLLTTFTVRTRAAQWIGYQVLFGFGLGCGMQQTNMAVQTVLPRRDIPTGTSLVLFAQALGGAVAMSAAQNVFQSRLGEYLGGVEGLVVPVGVVINAGATGLRNVVQVEVLGGVLEAFNRALVKALWVVVVCGCLTIAGAVGMEWKSIKSGEGQVEKECEDQNAEGRV